MTPGVRALGRLLFPAVVSGAVLGVPAAPLPAWAQDVAYSGSLQFATGDYLFTRRTDSFYVLNGLDLAAGRLYLQASVPVVVQNTPWISYGPTPIPSGGSQSGEVGRQLGERGQMGRRDREGSVMLPTGTLDTQAGIADPLISGTVSVFQNGGGLDLRLGGGVKLPVADPDDGFATGEWDYSGGLSISRPVSGRDSVFADLSYWRFGDMPDLSFRNTLAYSFAYGRTVRPGRWSILASVYGMTAVLEHSDPPVQVGFGLTRFFDNDRSVAVNAAVGLSETVPDFSIGLGWRLGL